MIFFWPNFDVRKEQVSNTKREHGQTDARKPSKSILTKNDPARIQTRKASNGCTKSLKSDFPPRSRSTHSRRREGTNGGLGPPKNRPHGSIEKSVSNTRTTTTIDRDTHTSARGFDSKTIARSSFQEPQRDDGQMIVTIMMTVKMMTNENHSRRRR